MHVHTIQKISVGNVSLRLIGLPLFLQQTAGDDGNDHEGEENKDKCNDDDDDSIGNKATSIERSTLRTPSCCGVCGCLSTHKQ